MRSVIIKIPRAGIVSKQAKVQCDAQGFRGSGCTGIVQQLTRALGSQTTLQAKPELYEAEPAEHIHLVAEP